MTENNTMSQQQIFIKMVLDGWHSKASHLDKLLTELSAEQLSKEVSPGRNRGIYLAGHLTALADSILTTAEIRQLRTTAHGLGLPDYFDDLRPTSPADLAAARAVVPMPREIRLCTHCHRPGHNRATCPELALIGG